MEVYARDSRFSGTVIGDTVSVGKTTTKSMIALVLESVFGDMVYQSYGIGVALSLIGIPKVVKIAVLEMGMSGKGEILELSRMARPNIRVILNVAASHLQRFLSLEEVAMAKGEILEEAKPGDACVLNADDPLVMGLPVQKDSEKGEVSIPSPGLHLAHNVCAAAVVANLSGVFIQHVGTSLSRVVPVHMRSEREVARSGINIINDAYNANPISMKAA